MRCRLFVASAFLILMLFSTVVSNSLKAQEKTAQENSNWKPTPGLLQPFWKGTTVDGESVLFVRDATTGVATGRVLFPVKRVLRVTKAAEWNQPDATVFAEGQDYVVTPGSTEITLPAGSRIPAFTDADLRRPAGSQKYKLTHRDGNGEIYFGGADEYHQMQVCVTYEHEPSEWPAAPPAYDATRLPKTAAKLKNREALSIVLLGDSISTGCNASGWAGVAPFQPAYQDLLLAHLKSVSSPNVTLTNLAVGGTSTPWGITRVPDVLAAKPDLVLLAFGMNDSSGRPAAEYKANIESMIREIRKEAPETEFILVATMMGNADWVTLKQELFPQYRQALQELTGPGIALADLTSMWQEMLKRKKDCDLTGNGVNHPNDFGHRVYAQVLTSILLPENQTEAKATREPKVIRLWPDKAPVDGTVTEESDAKITVHLPESPDGTAIVICPGGGYGGLVTGAEGHGIAKWLNKHGIAGIVLEYRLPKGRSFVPLLDAQRAIRIVRAHAAEWQLNPARVGIMGFSAGGHLASTAATHFEAERPDEADPWNRPSCRPDFAILVYPVVTMGELTHGGSRTNLLGPNPTEEMITLFSNEKQVNAQTPPMFLAHALDDKPVPPENSRKLYEALQNVGAESRYLELPSGGHGLNGYKGPMWDAWQTQSLEWLKALKLSDRK
ncbi:MAG: GDSL-type esterase/lipase family protein [Planctomycetaceae bacterium]